MNRFRSVFVAWLLIVAILARPTPAEAAAPLALLANPAVVGALVLTATVAGAALNYHAPAVYSSGRYAVSTAGDIATKVWQVQKLIGYAGKEYVFGKMVTAKNGIGDGLGAVAQWIRDHAATVPTLADALDKSTVYQTPVSGDVIKTTSGAYCKLTNYIATQNGTYRSNDTDPVDFWDKPISTQCRHWILTSRNYTSHQSWYTVVIWGLSSSTGPATVKPPSSVYPDDYSKRVPADSSTVAGEQDEVIKGNPGGTTVYDTDSPATALSGSAPANTPPTAEQTQTMIAQAKAAEVADYAEDVAAQAAADPTNAELQALALQAQQAASQAALDAQATEATPTEEAPPTEVTPPGAAPAPDADLAIDLSPLLGLKDRALSRFPFSIIASLGGFFDSLTAAPTSPSFSLPMPFGLQPYNLSLSSLDGIAEKWRLALAFFFHASCIYAIIRRYA